MPRPTFSPVLKPEEDGREGDEVCDTLLLVVEIAAGTEEVDNDGDEDEEKLLRLADGVLLVLGRLATISPVLSKKTPFPDSRQAGLSSQTVTPVCIDSDSWKETFICNRFVLSKNVWDNQKSNGANYYYTPKLEHSYRWYKGI